MDDIEREYKLGSPLGKCKIKKQEHEHEQNERDETDAEASINEATQSSLMRISAKGMLCMGRGICESESERERERVRERERRRESLSLLAGHVLYNR